MVEKLNNLLADLNVLYHKLQNFHWYIKGKDFFTVHAKLEEYYDNVSGSVDEIAEHILMLGGKPEANFSSYLKLAKIQEAPAQDITSDEVFKAVIHDFEYLLDSVKVIKKEADDADDYLTSALMDDYLKNYTKALWMLKQCIK